MNVIPKGQVLARIRTENPWWQARGVDHDYFAKTPRAYFSLYMPLLRETDVKRAVLLMGPRRVGKTVLIHHAIQDLLESGVQAERICYLSVDHPIYNGCGLQDLLDSFSEAARVDLREGQFFVFFDEIQYLKEWEIHLKVLVDNSPNIKFTASGSAAAALRLKSSESGAGRFTDFLLPPVTFYEYLLLLGKTDLLELDEGQQALFEAADIATLNETFLDYLNYGGYPEVIFSPAIRADPARFIKSDIIDKVLLRDLPSLYGIQDIQELNYLFTTLAYNTANEVSLEQLSQNSGVAKNTIKRYIEYLEAAFLVKVVHRIGRNARRFQRANFFKVYLTNPSIRTALFAPISADESTIGCVVETGVFSQWFHAPFDLHYARWEKGEVDIVRLNTMQKPSWALEAKWSDRYAKNPLELRSALSFCATNKLDRLTVTTRTVRAQKNVNGVDIDYVPASVYAYSVGFNLIKSVSDNSREGGLAR